MATVELTVENFEQVIGTSGTVLIDWWAPWCAPCMAFEPTYRQASDKHTGVTFSKLNVDEQPELVAAFSIQSIPTLMVFRDRVLLYAQSGALSADHLDELVTQVSALDMDEIKRKLDELERQMEAGESPLA